MTEFATLVSKVDKSLSEFRAANDAALGNKADKGYVDDQLSAKVAELNSAVTAAMDAAQARVDVMEQRLELLGGSSASSSSDSSPAEMAKEFESLTGRSVSADQYTEYCATLDQAMRRAPTSWTPEMRASMQVGVDPQGGYLVEPDRTGRIITRMFETSPMRQHADVQTIGTDELQGLVDRDESSAGWVGETGTRSETDTPDIGKWRIPVHEMYAEPRITQKLLDDALFDVAGWLERKGGEKFTRVSNSGFVVGDGSVKPRGFLDRTYVETGDDTRTFGELEYVKTGVNGAWPAADPGDVLVDLLFRLRPEYVAGAIFAMRRVVEASVRKLKDGDGTYLWQSDFEQRSGRLILGHPVENFEDMPAIAAGSLSIAVGDFRRGYTIVDRRGVTVLRDPYTLKGWVKFYMTMRVGGDVTDSDAIKALKFAA